MAISRSFCFYPIAVLAGGPTPSGRRGNLSLFSSYILKLKMMVPTQSQTFTPYPSPFHSFHLIFPTHFIISTFLVPQALTVQATMLLASPPFFPSFYTLSPFFLNAPRHASPSA